VVRDAMTDLVVRIWCLVKWERGGASDIQPPDSVRT
jgi:hypothetical protein